MRMRMKVAFSLKLELQMSSSSNLTELLRPSLWERKVVLGLEMLEGSFFLYFWFYLSILSTISCTDML